MREKRQVHSNRKKAVPYLLASPYLVHLLLFVLFPVVFSIVLTFHSWNIIAPMQFIGIDNYIHLFQDRLFWLSLRNTLLFLLIHIPLQVGIALMLAYLLTRQGWFKAFFRASFFMPVVISGVVVTILWQQLFGLDYGLLNKLLVALGMNRVEWLSDPSVAMISIALMATWKNVGLYVILFLVGLQSVPKSYYEAADVEGASSWQQFRYITLPAIQPTVFMVAILSTIGGFSLFIEPYIMTDGGPLNSTMSAMLYIYKQAFGYYHMGYSATLGLCFAMLIMIVIAIQKAVLEKDG